MKPVKSANRDRNEYKNPRDPRRRPTLAERQDDLKKRMLLNTPNIPAYYLDNDKRVRRVKRIREFMHMTHAEFAKLMGTTERYWQKIEWQQIKCSMMAVKLAEREFHAARLREKRRVMKEERRLQVSLAAIEFAEMDVLEDAEMRAKAISMYVRGESEEAIARELALSPDTLQHWISTLADEGADGD